jgi:type I restriction enzyme S subunit
MKTRTLPLAEVCEFVKDGTHASPERTEGGIPVLSAEHVNDGRLSFATDRFTSEKELEVFRKRLCPSSGDVLMTIVGTIGRAAVLTKNMPCVFQRSVCVFRPNSGLLDSYYLRHVLESDAVKRQLERETRQVAQAGVYLESLNEIEIPIPPLPEQQRIAGQLEQADRLRRTRRYALELSDTFLPAAFLELFGDHVRNPKNLRIAELGEFLSFVTSGSRGWAEYYVPDGDRFIRSLDVRMNHISDENAVFVNAPEGTEADRTRVKTGDVLLTITGSQIGRIAPVLPRVDGAFVSQHVAILRLKPGLLPVFLSMFMSLESGGQREIARLQYGQTKPGLSLGQIREFKIPVPPLPLQQQFAALVARHERLRAVQRESLRQAEHLFQSLLHRAFAHNLQ